MATATVRKKTRGEERLGGRIRQLRLGKSMTQAELAKKIGISRVAVTSCENGKSMFTPANLLKAAKALGTTVEHLLRG